MVAEYATDEQELHYSFSSRPVLEIVPPNPYNEIPGHIIEKIRSTPTQIDFITQPNISKRQRGLLTATAAFADIATATFLDGFLPAFANYRRDSRVIDLASLQYMADNGLTHPQFTLADGYTGQQMLEDFEFDDFIESSHALLVYRPPKPLEQFWWKGKRGKGSTKVGEDIAAWGCLSQQTRNLFWQAMADHEANGPLCFRRINDIGDHTIGEFHYLLEVAFKEPDGMPLWNSCTAVYGKNY